jgi:hypothetical protein
LFDLNGFLDFSWYVDFSSVTGLLSTIRSVSVLRNINADSFRSFSELALHLSGWMSRDSRIDRFKRSSYEMSLHDSFSFSFLLILLSRLHSLETLFSGIFVADEIACVVRNAQPLSFADLRRNL